MKINLPVTQVEHVLPDAAILVSTTDLKGRITHCNQDFVQASGYAYDELLEQPHDIVRHPDVPPEAFKDLWATIGRGRPWSGIVKNRCKNGDHYWVHANVTPVMENGKPKAYMSVRLKPTRAEIEAVESLYARIDLQRNSGRHTFSLHAGKVRPLGWRDGLGKLKRLSLFLRAGVGLGILLLLTLSPTILVSESDVITFGLMQLGIGVVSAALFMRWFSTSVTSPLTMVDHLAGELAGCNLDGEIEGDTTTPTGPLMRRLGLIKLNMRAIVADVRSEVVGLTHSAQGIVQGSIELSKRTEAQSQEVEKAAASVEQISASVRETAETAQDLARLSSVASSGASNGAYSIGKAFESMQKIESASTRITDIVDVIEKLAFQTNLLALNAAVEAAHAGEDGRGFAVVASEVRALAQRSSAASQQIRGLIQTSADLVSAGTITVNVAATTIRDAVEQVHSVTNRLGEITSATQQEHVSVSQIGDAMQLLDDVARSNAELVQQSMLACETLLRRSGTLHRAVKIFTLNDAQSEAIQ